MVPPDTLLSGQPACVQVAVNPSNVPLAGWVTTTFCWLMITPPPTGTCEAATRAAALVVGVFDAPSPAVAEGEAPPAAGVLEEPPPPQAASSGRLSPPTAAPASARRRFRR